MRKRSMDQKYVLKRLTENKLIEKREENDDCMCETWCR